jgi:hypothetical protein
MEYRSFVYDSEIYPNLFLAIFKSLDGTLVQEFERSDWCDDLAELDAFLAQEALELIGFNNHFYDDIVLKEILHLRSRGEAVTNARLKQANDALILHRKQLVKGHRLHTLGRVPPLRRGRPLLAWQRAQHLAALERGRAPACADREPEDAGGAHRLAQPAGASLPP